jgi:hypothetical protein
MVVVLSRMSARLSLAALSMAALVASQTTAAPSFLGYVVDNGVPVTTAQCVISGMKVFSTSKYMYCEYGSDGWVRTSCRGTNVLYSSRTASMAATCEDACNPLTVIESWPSGGKTWTMFECLHVAGLDEPVGTVYRTIDSLSGSRPPESGTTTTSEPISSTPPTSASDSTTAFESAPSSTDNNDTEDAGDGKGGSISNGALVGAVVGSVLGTLAIAGAGFCLFRRRRRHTVTEINQEPMPGVSPLNGRQQEPIQNGSLVKGESGEVTYSEVEGTSRSAELGDSGTTAELSSPGRYG